MNKFIEFVVAAVVIGCMLNACSGKEMDNKELTVIVQAQQQTIKDLQNQVDHLNYMVQDHEHRLDDIEYKLHM